MMISLGHLGEDAVPCMPIGDSGPLQPGQGYCESPVTCMPTGAQGPLSPGQVYCDTGSTTPPYLPPLPLAPNTQQQGNTMLWIGLAAVAAIAFIGMRRS